MRGLALTIGLAGCSFAISTKGPPDDATPDVAVADADGPPDAIARVDAGPDASAIPDAAPDSAPDGAPDSGPDATPACDRSEWEARARGLLQVREVWPEPGRAQQPGYATPVAFALSAPATCDPGPGLQVNYTWIGVGEAVGDRVRFYDSWADPERPEAGGERPSLTASSVFAYVVGAPDRYELHVAQAILDADGAEVARASSAGVFITLVDGGCADDAECGAGEMCVGGVCEAAGCGGDAACPDGQFCVDGVCRECLADDDCVRAQCVNGECR